MIARLITAAPAVTLAGVMLAAGIWAVVHSLRGAHRTYNAILDDFHQPRKENPKP